MEVWADSGRQAVYCVRQVPQPMPAISVATGDDPLPLLALGQALAGYTLVSGPDAAAGSALRCPSGTGPAVTGNGYGYNRNEWTWSCIKNWVDEATVAAPSPSASSDPVPSDPEPASPVASPSAAAVPGSLEVMVSSRSLSVGQAVTVSAMRKGKVVKRWQVTAQSGGRVSALVPRALRGARIILAARGRVIFDRVVR